MIAIPAGLIVLQNDTGTAIMVFMSGVFVILLAGIRWRFVFAGLFAGLLGSPAWYLFLAQAHQKNRILTFLDPYRDPTGAGYNIIQSQIAIGSGGIYGKGYGNGAQSHLDFIPESHTDFILAVLAEEFGLLGVLFLIGLYLFVLLRVLRSLMPQEIYLVVCWPAVSPLRSFCTFLLTWPWCRDWCP